MRGCETRKLLSMFSVLSTNEWWSIFIFCGQNHHIIYLQKQKIILISMMWHGIFLSSNTRVQIFIFIPLYTVKYSMNNVNGISWFQHSTTHAQLIQSVLFANGLWNTSELIPLKDIPRTIFVKKTCCNQIVALHVSVLLLLNI